MFAAVTEVALGQITEAERVINEAGAHSWEAALLAFIVLMSFGAFGWTMRMLMIRHLEVEKRTLDEAKDRETRLAQRVSTLEDLIRGELLALIRQNSEAMGKVMFAADSICRAADRMTQTLDRFTSVLDVRPCLLPIAEQRKLIKEVQDVVENNK